MKQPFLTLPAYNAGRPFQVVRVRRNDDDCIGIVDEEHSTTHAVAIWIGYDVFPTMFDRSVATRTISLDETPEYAFDSVSTVTGGIGSHTRWRVLVEVRGAATRSTVLLSEVHSDDQMACIRSLVATNIISYDPSEEACRTYCSASASYTYKVLAYVSCIARLQTIAASCRILCTSVDDHNIREGEICPERIDRAKHQWNRQFKDASDGDAGPIRCVHNWNQPYIPITWSCVFTWSGIAKQVLRQYGVARVLREMHMLNEKLQNELRHHVWLETHAALRAIGRRAEAVCAALKRADRATDDANALRAELAELKTKAAASRAYLWMVAPGYQNLMTPPVTAAQNAQILNAWYQTCYDSVSDPTLKHALCLVLFRALLCGWNVRVIGKYVRSGRHVGYGKKVRRFGDAVSHEYERHRHSMAVRNRIRTCDEGTEGMGALIAHKRRRGASRRTDIPRAFAYRVNSCV